MEQIYADVPVTSPYFADITFVSGIGLMSGTDKGTFSPNQMITRAELCAYISHFCGLKLKFSSERNEISHGLPTWATPFYSACESAGLLPSNFLDNINNIVSVNESLNILLNATKKIFGIIWKDGFWFLSVKPPTNDYLTRGQFASIISQLCNSIAYLAEQELFKNGPHFEQFFSITQRFKWVTDFFTDTHYQIFYLVSSYVETVPRNFQIMHMLNISDRMSIFSYTESQYIYHYTTLKTLDKLTQPNATFHLSNIAYLNDPQEGKLGMKLLRELHVKDINEHIVWSALQTDDDEFSIYPTFIASFMKKPDELPMWVQYGDKGAGCCLGFSCTKVSKPLYAVKYSEGEIQTFFSDIMKILEDYQHEYSIKDCDSDPVFKYAHDILIQVCFLYKSDHYQHEEEVRIITFVPFKNAKVAIPTKSNTDSSAEPNELFFKVYSESPLSANPRKDTGLDFASITLGPTVPNSEQVAVALAQRGYDPKIIKKSKISFR